MLNSIGRGISTIGLSQCERRIARATWSDETAVSDQDLAGIAEEAAEAGVDDCVYIIHLIGVKLQDRRWQVVVKSLTVLHRSIRDGSSIFLHQLGRLSDLLSLRSFSDMRNTASFSYSDFVACYSFYLGKKMEDFCNIGYDIERFVRQKKAGVQQWIEQKSFEELMELIPIVHRQMTHLFGCECHIEGNSIHPLNRKPLMLLIKDGIRLYSLLTIVAFLLIDRFQSLNQSDCSWALEELQRFFSTQTSFKQWSQRLCTFRLISEDLLPDFDNVPERIVKTLKKSYKRRFSKSSVRSTSADPPRKTANGEVRKKKMPKARSSSSSVVSRQLGVNNSLSPEHLLGSAASSRSFHAQTSAEPTVWEEFQLPPPQLFAQSAFNTSKESSIEQYFLLNVTNTVAAPAPAERKAPAGLLLFDPLEEKRGIEANPFPSSAPAHKEKSAFDQMWSSSNFDV